MDGKNYLVGGGIGSGQKFFSRCISDRFFRLCIMISRTITLNKSWIVKTALVIFCWESFIFSPICETIFRTFSAAI